MMLALLAVSVLQGPVTNPANGHAYYLLSSANWTDSEAFAKTLGGHLATVRSQAENDWIFSTFTQDGTLPRALWIGFTDQDHPGVYDAATGLSTGVFAWASGEPAAYANFSAGQPNNVWNASQPAEEFAHMWPPDGRGGIYGGGPAGSWNDYRDDSLVDGQFALYGVAEVEDHVWPLDGNGDDVSGGLAMSVPQSLSYRAGKTGSALACDGSGAFAQAAESYAGPFTVSLWVKANDPGQTDFTSALSTGFPGDYADHFQFDLDGSGHWQVDVGNQIVVPISDAKPAFQHLALSYDGSTLRSYLDGAAIATVPFSESGALGFETLKLCVNRDQNRPFSGLVDDVRIFHRALSGPEVAQLAGFARVAVVNRGTQSLDLVAGTAVTRLASGFSDALDVVELASGNLLVSDRGGAGTLYTIDPATGAILGSESPGFRPDDLQVLPDGTLLASAFFGGVWRRRPGETSFTQIADVPGDLTSVHDPFVLDSSGRFFRIAPDGTYAQLLQFPSETHGIADLGSDLLVAENGAGRVDRLSGTTITTFADGLPRASKLVPDGAGGYFLTLQDDPGSIVRLDASGHAAYVVDHDPRLASPRGIVVLQPATQTAPPPDTTPPATTAAASPLPNANGWNATPVTVTLQATDDASGVAGSEISLDGGGWIAYAGPVTIAAEGAHTLRYRSTDKAGNVEAAHALGFEIDRTPPVVSVPGPLRAIATSAAGAQVTFGASASDALSGASAPSCSATSGQTFAPGVTAVTCSSTDGAGNTGSASFTVSVSFDWSGFESPLTASENRAFGAGADVPVKFRLSGASLPATGVPARLFANGRLAGSFSIEGGKYIAHFRGGTPGTYVLRADLGDASDRSVTIVLH